MVVHVTASIDNPARADNELLVICTLTLNNRLEFLQEGLGNAMGGGL